MNKVDKGKRSSDCDNSTGRSKRKRLEGSVVSLEKLPTNCLQHILSFVTCEKVSEIKQVCNVFNKIGKKLLDNKQRELEKRLKREIKMAEKRVLYPTNLTSSYDMLYFLSALHKSISNRNVTDKFYTEDFVAGKLLDKANGLLKDFHSLTVVPYLQEDVCDEIPHPLLDPIVALCEIAYFYYTTKISPTNTFGAAANERFRQRDLKMAAQIKQNKLKAKKLYLLKIRRHKIDCGNEMSRQFLKLIPKLNENVLDLTHWAKTLDEEAKGVIDRSDKAIVPTDKSLSNFLFLFFASSTLFYREKKVFGILISKRPNLATLPSSCIHNIVSNWDFNEMSQLRIICKSFNEVCKNKLEKAFEVLKHRVEFKRKKLETIFAISDGLRLFYIEINILKNVGSLLRLFKDNLGDNFYFAAGKVLDKTNIIVNTLKLNYLDAYDSVSIVKDFVYKAIAHHKFYIVPKFFPSTHRVYVSDYIIWGGLMSLPNESLMSLEEVENLIEETVAKIQEQNERNRELFEIIFGLKKKFIILNKELSERINLLKELELKI